MHVYMFPLGDMKLHYRLLRKPEQLLGSIHLSPCRAPVCQAYRDMLPSILALLTSAHKHPQIPKDPMNDEGPEVISIHGLVLLISQEPILLRLFPWCRPHPSFLPSCCVSLVFVEFLPSGLVCHNGSNEAKAFSHFRKQRVPSQHGVVCTMVGPNCHFDQVL